MLQEGAIVYKGSEAFEYLRSALAHPGTYKVSVDIRSDGMAVKVNESMWTPTMDTKDPYN